MKTLILGHKGMLGSAVHRQLPDAHIIEDLEPADLREKTDVRRVMQDIKPECVYMCAARVGGIQRNLAEPGKMIRDNLMIQTNCIHEARNAGVKVFVLPGSSCIYPVSDFALREEDIMTGKLERSNEPYAMAKLAGISMLDAYAREYGMKWLVPMPCNLYGPGDNYKVGQSHFLAGMIKRFHETRARGELDFIVWGDGSARREVMHVNDCARIMTELVVKDVGGVVNIGWGRERTIKQWAALVAETVAPEQEWKLTFDPTSPTGVRRKLLDVNWLWKLGCGPTIEPEEGIKAAYLDYLVRFGDQ